MMSRLAFLIANAFFSQMTENFLVETVVTSSPYSLTETGVLSGVTIHFTRFHNPTRNCDSIDSVDLGSCLKITDLGIIVDTTMSFNNHTDSIVCKTLECSTSSKDYIREETEAIMTLFNCLVRSVLEHCSVIYNLVTAVILTELKGCNENS